MLVFAVILVVGAKDRSRISPYRFCVFGSTPPHRKVLAHPFPGGAAFKHLGRPRQSHPRRHALGLDVDDAAAAVHGPHQHPARVRGGPAPVGEPHIVRHARLSAQPVRGGQKPAIQRRGDRKALDQRRPRRRQPVGVPPIVVDYTRPRCGLHVLCARPADNVSPRRRQARAAAAAEGGRQRRRRRRRRRGRLGGVRRPRNPRRV
ncbi:hypothetical protein DFJ73DRAFT_818176 [Zopfochytrium polystomum]|nr:hypothetical protein DFJ73DRAFT_818176 [Zopfochytrium polystomum]